MIHNGIKMKKILTFFTVLCLLSTLFLTGLAFNVQPARSASAAWTVDDDGPADFSSIQDAIDSPQLVDGDTVFVHSGTYYERVVINKAISLVGADSSSTIIDGEELDNCITLNQVNGGEIKNFTVKNGSRGIMLRACEDIVIDGNVILENDDSGLYLEDSHNNTIRNNDIDNIWAITLGNSWGNLIENNDISAPHPCTVKLSSSSNNVVRNNIISGGPCVLLRIMQSDNNLIANNELKGISRNGEGVSRHGIYIGYSKDNIIANNEISSIREYGICLYHADNTQVLANTISNPETGVRIGVLMWGNSCNNLIKGNEIFDMPRGITLHYGTNNNQIVNNKVSNSTIDVTIEKSNNNTIYQNNFEDTQIQAFDDGNNEWSYNGMGNYWGDYTGEDDNNDNIGDSSYQIPLNGSDPFPSMTAYSIETINTPSLDPIEFYDLQYASTTLISNNVTWEGQTKDVLTDVGITNGGSLTIINSTLTFFPQSEGWGLHVDAGGTLRIINSKIFGNGILIDAGENSSVEIENSEIYSLWSWDSHPEGSIKADNIVMKNNLFVDVWNIPLRSNSTFINNTIEKTFIAIDIFGSDCVVENNSIKNAIWTGIRLLNWAEDGSGGSNNIIRNNRIQNAWEYAIDVGYNCTDNQIYHNDFLSDQPSATVEGHDHVNVWYTENRGNFYSDYLDRYPHAEEHNDYEGIWNTPYEIYPGSENIDDFPSMYTFYEQEANAPATPALLLPTNDATINVLNPTFSWTASGDSVLYRLQVSEDADFLNPVVNWGDIDTTFASCNLEDKKTYYWRVIAKNEDGYSSWSETWATTTALIHDVTITSVTPSSYEIDQEQTLDITVVIQNNGNFTETFSVTLYANKTKIETLSIQNLDPSNQTTLTVNWNTAGFSLGTYTIKAEASVVEGEVYATDNVVVTGAVDVIPEFPPILILALFMTATLTATTVHLAIRKSKTIHKSKTKKE
jgi:parallel beta-helix repeat protein